MTLQTARPSFREATCEVVTIGTLPLHTPGCVCRGVGAGEQTSRDRTENSGNSKQNRKRGPNLFTLKEINIWNRLLEPAAKSQGTNEFNRYLLCSLGDERTKEKLDKKEVK